MADDPDFRWLGPHKGVVHLALAAVVNACFDLWAKAEEVPLWKLLIDLSPEAIASTLDFSYYEEVLTKAEAIALLEDQQRHREKQEAILRTGYAGYDTSIGWFNYSDEKVEANVKQALDES